MHPQHLRPISGAGPVQLSHLLDRQLTNIGTAVRARAFEHPRPVFVVGLGLWRHGNLAQSATPFVVSM